jgi:salicylate hydroxylase
VESWTERGTREACSRSFQGWNPEIHTIIANVDVPYKWALLGRDPLDRFVRGRACVIGDAAHPTLPFLAQGVLRRRNSWRTFGVRRLRFLLAPLFSHTPR